MKRILLVAAVILAACTALRAENTTRIGGDSRVDYGFYYGWNTGIHNYGMVFFDINAAQSNLRTRVGVGLAERFLKKGKYVGLNPNLSLDLQYLLRIADGFYLYPSVGLYGEAWSKKSRPLGEVNFGAEAGLGLEFQFSERIGLFVQGDYQLMFNKNTANRMGGRGGLVFNF